MKTVTHSISGLEATKTIKNTVDYVSDTVCSTMGAKGKLVVLTHQHTGHPLTTKDGVSVATSLNPANPYENQIAKILKESAVATLNEAGDGTTTTLSLLKGLMDTVNPKDKERAKKEVEDVISKVKELAKPVQDINDIFNISYISSNSDHEMAVNIAKAYTKVGLDGVVKAGQKNTEGYEISVKTGIRLTGGVVAPCFATGFTPSPSLDLEKANIFILDLEHVNDSGNLENIIQAVSNTVIETPDVFGGKMKKQKLLSDNLVILTRSTVRDDVIKFFAQKLENQINIANKGYKEHFKAISVLSVEGSDDRIAEKFYDLARHLGIKYLSEANLSDLKKIDDSFFYKVDKISSNNDEIVIDVDKKDSTHLGELKVLLNECNDKDVKAILRSRISQLSTATAIIECGKDTISNLTETRDRLDDALCSVKSAIKYGYVAGGGTTLKYLANSTVVIKEALQYPYLQILSNAGLKPTPVDRYGLGTNVLTGKLEDFIATGLVDSSKAITSALKNAFSTYEIISNIHTITYNEER
tara:strand:- start:1021 stop:2604 length:1584 start_codon:yes stop_codon:yes gene_type:complete